MKALVVGGSGLIGAAVVAELRAQHHTVTAPGRDELDLLNQPEELPSVDAAFICAGIKGLQPCEGNAESWRVNVDGALLLGLRLMRAGVKLVYVSSDAVEWSSSSYARQKAMVEIGLIAAGSPVIVRPSRVSKESVADLARLMVSVFDRPGIHYWTAA